MFCVFIMFFFFFFSSRRRHTRYWRDWSSDVCSSDLFADLTNAEFARASLEVRGQLKLRSFKSGEIICDEHERSDAVYLVRSEERRVGKECRSRWSADH